MKGKEIITGLILLAGIVLLFTACDKKEEDDGLDFTVAVPEDWLYYVVNQGNVVYYAQSPLEATDDSITEDLLVIKELASGQTLISYSNAVMDNLAEDTTYLPVSIVDTTINGEATRRIIHLQTAFAVNRETHDTTYLRAKMMKYIFLKDYNGYILSFSALETTYDAYKPVFDEIMSSFRFKN